MGAAASASARPGRFFDTNILVYSQDRSSPVKQVRARAVMEQAMQADLFVISTQVMQEFYNVMLRKRWMTAAQAAQILGLLADHSVVPANADSVLRSVALQQRDGLSVWDALIVQAALDARCAVLYSEDLQDRRRFASASGSGPMLQVVNPFMADLDAPAVHQPEATYRSPAGKRRAAPAPK